MSVSRISKNGPTVYHRKYRVLTNSVLFGDVVYGSPLIQTFQFLKLFYSLSLGPPPARAANPSWIKF